MRKIIVTVIVLILIGIQFIPVQRDNPSVSADVQSTADVKAILLRACYDCHSNATVWPWYGYVAPVSWLLATHVKEGRAHLNFSEWENYPPQRRARLAEEIWQEIEKGEMPLKAYAIIHKDAILNETDKEIVKTWSESFKEDGGEGEISDAE
ncbi:heme-binding protein [candidate division KSB1 bacterium]|nr:heme-binding domain-containing protein [candidate division KSB1 bacterium]RQW06774.1 MAG: heme-binding protein [candidate division KSB1 bacterium]